MLISQEKCLPQLSYLFLQPLEKQNIIHEEKSRPVILHIIMSPYKMPFTFVRFKKETLKVSKIVAIIPNNNFYNQKMHTLYFVCICWLQKLLVQPVCLPDFKSLDIYC